MAFEKSFNEDLARGLVGTPDSLQHLDTKLQELRERAITLDCARQKMANGYALVLEALKEAYPNLNLNDPNFAGSPDRMARALLEVCSGLGIDEQSVFSRSFPSGDYNEMIMLKDIQYSSLCAHHFFLFTGVVHIGYLPMATSEGGSRVVGVSKLARIVDVHANRPQIQERMCVDIMQAIRNALTPKGVMVVVEGRHGCLGCRGVKQNSASMITSALDGVFKSSAKLRAEFLALLKRKD